MCQCGSRSVTHWSQTRSSFYVLVTLLIAQSYDSVQIVNCGTFLHPNDNIFVARIWEGVLVQRCYSHVASACAYCNDKDEEETLRKCDIHVIVPSSKT
jgi:hypothetical protein